jgi:dTDP-4-amino-4,6-dideoxygalactose transaminase
MVIEDNAHGLGGKYRDTPLGTFGTLATLSFHETKNFSCGEGGAIIINDSSLLSRAEIIREKGTDRSRFFRGEVAKYGWVDVGSSFLPSEILAAYLLAQLEAAHVIQDKRERLWNLYNHELRDWANASNVDLPYIPADRQQAFHMFYMLMPSLNARTLLIDKLKENGILAVFHYQPLHLSVMGRRLGYATGDCPVTERICDRLVRLPFFTGLSLSEQHEVIDAVQH